MLLRFAILSLFSFRRSDADILSSKRIIIFYPVCALITLFCNILLKPLHERAEGDVQFINSAAEFMGNIPSNQLGYEEMIHSKMIHHFLCELGRLAECAIDRAKKKHIDKS